MAKKQIWDEKLNKDCSLKSNFLFIFQFTISSSQMMDCFSFFMSTLSLLRTKTAKPKYAKSYQWGGISFNNFKLFFQFCIWDNLQVLLNSSSTVLLWAYNFVIWGHLHGKPREMLWFFVFITLLFSNVVVWGDIRAYHMIPVKRLKIRTLSSLTSSMIVSRIQLWMS